MPGYRGKTPVITPTVLHVSDKWDFAKWGGDSSRPDRPSPGLPLIKHKRECPAGTPSLLSVWCSRTSPPIAAGHPWALRRPDGRRSAHRRTIPRRRSAAPSGQGELPFVKCGIAAKPARRSLPRQAQTGSGFPSERCSRCRSAARGKRQQSGRSKARCGSETGSKPDSCRPCHAGSPGTPPPARPPRSSGPGVSARSSPAARPPCRPGTHSLSGPRRCPRSMTPGTAAAPAPGCWLRCLRSMRSGTAAERLLQPEAAKGYGTKPKAAPVRGLILRITGYKLYAIASNCRAAMHGCTRITAVIRITGHAGQRQQAAKGYDLQRQGCCSCPQRSGPLLLHAAQQPGPDFGPW